MKLAILRAAVLAFVAAGSITALSAEQTPTTPRHPQSPIPICHECTPTPVGGN